jgi:catalase
MPKVLETDVTPEVDRSPSLSLFARPGDGSVKARRVAILVAPGTDVTSAREVSASLLAAGAVPRFVSSTLGSIGSGDGESLDVDASFEATPSVLYDAVVIPAGPDGIDRLVNDGRALEFVKDQYRHCKPILVSADGSSVLQKAGIPVTLPDGKADPGILSGGGETQLTVDAFIARLAAHRQFERETDPPRV